MTTVGNIYDIINSFAPFDSQMGFDNAGLLIGSREREVTRVMVALDASASAAQQAIDRNCQLLVTHHPFIFRPVKCISSQSTIYKLIAGGVDVISAHTNLDVAPGGVNECLVRALGFEGFERLEEMPFCMVGTLAQEMSAAELAVHVCKALDISGVQLADSGRPVRKAAVICGSGGGEVYDLLGSADVLITGEAKHHELLDARDGGMSVIAAGHFATERLIVRQLADCLAERCPDAEFFCAEEYAPEEYIVRL